MDTQMEDINNFELSTTVIEGLQNLAKHIPLELTKKLIANALKLMLHPEATIPSVPDIYAQNVDKAKRSEYAVVTLFALGTKHLCNGMKLRQLLEKHSVDVLAIDELIRIYEDNCKELIFRQIQVGHSFPHITDVQWRIVCDFKSSTCNASSGETSFQVNFGRYRQGLGERETIVEFLCNTEELQSLINKLKEIERHCEKVATE